MYPEDCYRSIIYWDTKQIIDSYNTMWLLIGWGVGSLSAALGLGGISLIQRWKKL